MAADAPPLVLLDTCLLISPPAGGLDAIPGSAAVASISVAELEYGLDAASDPVERRRRQRRLDVLLETFDVLPFDRPAARSYGLLASLLRAAGRDPRSRRLDLLIAATAERHGLALATYNVDDFRYLDRVLEIVAVT